MHHHYRLLSWVSLSLALATGLLSGPPVLAGDCVSPINEACDGAIVFTTTDLPFAINGSTACSNDVVDKPYFDAFYRYDATQTGTHIIDMCDSSGDTYLRVYSGGCGWVDGVEIAVADDECSGSPPNADPVLAIELQAGQSYWVEVGTWRPEPPWAPPANAPFVFNVTLEDQPPNLSCDGTGLVTAMIGNPDNAVDTTGLGSVPNFYRMGQFETTNRMWVDFLNAIAIDDPNGVYNIDMNDSDRGGILRSGTPGSFTYFVKESFGDKPVNFISWQDAARYANWNHNGRPVGAQSPATTENGAYDLSVPADQIIRSPGSLFYIPTHDEWYKAAYFDPNDPAADGGGTPDYWLYPTSNDSLPGQASATAVGDVANPGTNIANYGSGADWNGENGNVTSVGSATALSPWGMADMAGNILEVTETADTPIDPDTPTRTARGGDFSNAGVLMSSPTSFALALNMAAEAANVGFRLAANVCLGDFDGNNQVDQADQLSFEACFTGPGGGSLTEFCTIGDFDMDMDVDCEDWNQLVQAWTGLTDPIDTPSCSETIIRDGFESIMFP